jgi:flagellin
MGGRNAEMTFGIGKIDYSEVFGATRTIDAGLPNAGQLMNLTSMPSDAVVGPTFSTTSLKAGKIYEITTLPADATDLTNFQNKLLAAGATTIQAAAEVKVGSTFTVTQTTDLDMKLPSGTAQMTTLKKGETYKVTVKAADNATGLSDIDKIALLTSDITDTGAHSDLIVNSTFTVDGATDITGLSGSVFTFQRITPDTGNGDADGSGVYAEFRQIDASKITRNIEAVQKKINTGRVQAGSQYAALESAVIYTTDLTAQYELGYNTVHDVNFSMETAHLAKNQILQQAATAMLAQANQGQQGLLQLIQG